MKRSLSVLVALLLLPLLSMAQRGSGRGNGNGNGGGGGYNNNIPVRNDETSTLSIFSENGQPFYLILNGIKQNLVPQTKIRVEALPQYITDVNIMFADNRMAPLRKKIVVSDPVDGGAVNLTLKITSFNGRPSMNRLQFHRMTDVERNYRGPRDEYVMYYGKPQQINTVTETTYRDPVTGQQVTQTTTTTTDNYNNNGYNNNTPPPPMAMDQRSFQDAKQSIANSSFDDTKLSTAKTILNSNYMNTNQVMEICKLFSFENNRLAFAKYAYNRTVDPGNYFKVANVLDFDSNRKALNDFINSNPR